MPAASAKTKKKAGPALSERTKNILLISTGSVLVIVLGWWAFYRFTTIAPPDLKNAKPEDVVDYLGNTRGLARLRTVEQQRDYLLNSYKTFSEGESRERMIAAISRMSRSEREVLGGVVFDIARVDVVNHAREYNRTPPAKRAAFVDKAIRNFESLRGELSGAKIAQAPNRSTSDGASRGPVVGGPAPMASLAEPFKQDMPKGSDAVMKTLIGNTSATERAEAKPFIDALGERYNQLKDPKERSRFNAAGT